MNLLETPPHFLIIIQKMFIHSFSLTTQSIKRIESEIYDLIQRNAILKTIVHYILNQ